MEGKNYNVGDVVFTMMVYPLGNYNVDVPLRRIVGEIREGVSGFRYYDEAGIEIPAASAASPGEAEYKFLMSLEAARNSVLGYIRAGEKEGKVKVEAEEAVVEVPLPKEDLPQRPVEKGEGDVDWKLTDALGNEEFFGKDETAKPRTRDEMLRRRYGGDS